MSVNPENVKKAAFMLHLILGMEWDRHLDQMREQRRVVLRCGQVWVAVWPSDNPEGRVYQVGVGNHKVWPTDIRKWGDHYVGDNWLRDLVLDAAADADEVLAERRR